MLAVTALALTLAALAARTLYARAAVGRRAVVRAAAASMALAVAPSTTATLLRLINRVRARAHVAQLHDDGSLARVARACREDVLAACSRRLGVRATALGENTALDIVEGPREALEVWLESPPHRANMLDPEWRTTGFAVLQGTTYVQVFGR
jgi:uncharacterized protein YkwD